MLHAIPEKPQNLDAAATFVAILLSLVDHVHKARNNNNTVH